MLHLLSSFFIGRSTTLLLMLLIWCSQSASLKAQTQEIPSTSVPLMFYGGVQSLQSRYEVFYPSTPHLSVVKPWQLVAGARLSSRWSIQLGYTYSRDIFDLNPSYTGTNDAGEPTSGSRYSGQWEQAAPLVLRYSLVQRSVPRLQLDAIVGTTLVASRFEYDETRKVNSLVVYHTHSSDRTTQLYITAGLGLRYPFGKHFEGVFDYSYSRNLKSVSEGLHLQVTGNRFGLTRAYSLGVRYRFNFGKRT